MNPRARVGAGQQDFMRPPQPTQQQPPPLGMGGAMPPVRSASKREARGAGRAVCPPRLPADPPHSCPARERVRMSRARGAVSPFGFLGLLALPLPRPCLCRVS